ncbi:MAG: hypothetical protein ACE5IR_28980 [bacterium]
MKRESLEEIIAKRQITVNEALDILHEITEGLAKAHEIGYLVIDGDRHFGN